MTFSPTALATAPTSPCCDADLSSEVQVPESPAVGGCYSICTMQNIGTDFVEAVCDLAALGGTGLSSAQAVAVHDPPGGTDLCPQYGGGGYKPYCAFGVDAHGRDFYCAWDTTHSGRELTGVAVHGGPEDDVIQFWWDYSSTEFNLDVFSGFEGDLFTGTARGFQGDDQVLGSRSVASVYQDRLFGGADDDKICGHDGDDVADGEAAHDLVCGDDGDDDLKAAAGDDTLCGGDDVDVLDAGPDNDFLDHGGQTGDSNDGGTGTDECNSSGDPNCEAAFTPPSFCDS